MQIKWIVKYLCIACVFGAFAPSAPAEIKAEALLTNCTSESNVSIMYCVGFIEGYVNGVKFASAETGKKYLCFPDGGATNRQMRAIVIKFFKEHPALWHEPAGFATLVALLDVFPCSDKKQPELDVK